MMVSFTKRLNDKARYASHRAYCDWQVSNATSSTVQTQLFLLTRQDGDGRNPGCQRPNRRTRGFKTSVHKPTGDITATAWVPCDWQLCYQSRTRLLYHDVTPLQSKYVHFSSLVAKNIKKMVTGGFQTVVHKPTGGVTTHMPLHSSDKTGPTRMGLHDRNGVSLGHLPEEDEAVGHSSHLRGKCMKLEEEGFE